jgi:hypothetical protein
VCVCPLPRSESPALGRRHEASRDREQSHSCQLDR